IPTLHGKIFEGIFPMWKFAKLLPSKQTKSNLTFTIYCPNFGGNYIYYIAENIRNKNVSCVMSFWNNDQINPGTKLPALLEKFISVN
ncbi:hypothetical protein KSK37_03155, partial [Kaistella sp. DKR-2]|nr:hypothetical protein [Kaistella soli]